MKTQIEPTFLYEGLGFPINFKMVLLSTMILAV